MSKGLGDLELDILFITLEDGQGFLTCRDILLRLWQWQAHDWGSRISAVGANEYAAAHVSVSRSIRRLQRRGLIEIWKSLSRPATAISLTNAGAEIARRREWRKGTSLEVEMV
jgi:hypothetical protein